jgi:hypothetical protein
VTRLFGDYSFADNGKDIESIGNTTIIPNSVIKDIKKLGQERDPLAEVS